MSSSILNPQVAPTQPAPAVQNPPAQTSDSMGAEDSDASDATDATVGSVGVNLHKKYSALNSALTKLFDKSGVRRSFTVPYVDGQPMADHIKSVGAAARQTGGLTKSLVTSSHSSEGKGWGSGDGETIGHPAHDLRKTVIMPNDENAQAALEAAQRFLNGVAKLLGKDNPTIKTAQSQLDLVKRNDASGVTLLDLGQVLIQITHVPLQTVVRAHNNKKSNGPGHALLQAPRKGMPQPEQPEEQGPNA